MHSRDGCVLPAQPANGKYIVIGSTERHQPGEKVASSTVLNITCKTGYRVESEYPTTICLGKNWLYEIPKCKRKSAV